MRCQATPAAACCRDNRRARVVDEHIDGQAKASELGHLLPGSNVHGIPSVLDHYGRCTSLDGAFQPVQHRVQPMQFEDSLGYHAGVVGIAIDTSQRGENCRNIGY